MALIAFLTVAAEGMAQFTPGQSSPPVRADQLVDVRVLTDRGIVGPGETFHVMAVFDIKKPWHMYWRNPGEAGALPPSIEVTAPDGFTVGETRWPRPKRLESPAGEMFCYEDQLALIVPVTAPMALRSDEVTLETAVRFAVCDADRCLFGRNTMQPTIRTHNSEADGKQASDAETNGDAELAKRHLQRLPHNINESRDATIAVRDETLILTAPSHGFDQVTFFPEDTPGVSYGSPDINFSDDRVTVKVPLSINRNNFRGGPPKVGGLLALGRAADDPGYEGAIALSP